MIVHPAPSRRSVLGSGVAALTAGLACLAAPAAQAGTPGTAAVRDGVPLVPLAATNLVANGAFEAGTRGWFTYGSRVSSTGAGAVRVVGTGSLGGVGVYSGTGNRPTVPVGHRLHVQARARVCTPGAVRLVLLVSDGRTQLEAARVPAPAQDAWQRLAGVVTVPASFEGAALQVYVLAFHASPGAAAGAVVEAGHVLALDLTDVYGRGLEQPATLVAPLVETRFGGHFEGRVERFDALPDLTAVPAGKAGPRVRLRFDDGYENNLLVAAPIMAKYGFVGTLYTGTHPTQWLGTMRPAGRVLSVDGLRRLHEEHGWEIGSHTRMHHDAVATPLPEFVTSMEQSIQDLLSYGLPHPVSFAYPNGSRTASADRYVYRLFEKCAITGGPEKPALAWNAPTFYLGWRVIPGSGSEKEAMFAQAQQYVRDSIAQGRNPVLGFHGVDDGPAAVSYSLDAVTFDRMISWLWSEGYAVGTTGEIPAHNLVRDPGFERTAPGGADAPWRVNTTVGGWRRTSAGPQVGLWGMVMDTAGTPVPPTAAKTFSQRIPVTAGTEYRTYLDVNVSQHRSGAVRLNAYFYDAAGRQVPGTAFDLAVVRALTAGNVSRAGRFTAPPGAVTAELTVQTSTGVGFDGVAHVGHVAAFPASLVDPLAA